MKKTLLLLLVITSMAFQANAQDNGPSLGIKAGANFSNVYDEQGQDFNADGKIGFVGGGFLTIPIFKILGVQPEVLFSQKGFKATGTVLGSPYSITRTTNYIDVPLMIFVKPIPQLSILAGPQYSYLLKQKNVFKGAGTTVLQQEEFNNDNLRKNILCFIGGVDVNLDHVVIGARVGWDLQNNHGDGTSNTPRYKNTWVQATLGLKI